MKGRAADCRLRIGKLRKMYKWTASKRLVRDNDNNKGGVAENKYRRVSALSGGSFAALWISKYMNDSDCR
jgi:hypothetical protein